MSDTAASGAPPLWDDRHIEYVMKYESVHERYPDAEWVIRLLLQNLRDEMQAELASLRAANAELERALQEARAWQPVPETDVLKLIDYMPGIMYLHVQGYVLCRLAPASQPASDGEPEGDGGQDGDK